MDLYFRELVTGGNFVKNIFAISAKCVGVMREEGVAPKILQIFFSRQAEICEICGNKFPLKNPAIWYIHVDILIIINYYFSLLHLY